MVDTEQHVTTATGKPLSTQTFVGRVLGSAAMQSDGELEILTATSIIRGRPTGQNYVSDLWHRTREQITAERHDPRSRLPDATGGSFLELADVRVTAIAAPDRETRFDDLVVFTDAIVALRATARPKQLAH